MAEIVSDVVAKLLEYMGKLAFEKIAPYFGGKRRLKEIELTMVMIQARLLDAERRGEGQDGEALVKNWLNRLKSVLYQLEDLFEEVAVAAKEGEQVRGGMLTKPVRLLISSSNSLKINKKVAKEAKAIMEELKAITLLMNSLNFRDLPMEKHRCVDKIDSSRETHSYVKEEEVIGRDEDKSKIVAMLLDSDHGGENVSVIPIVGIGGLGKTTLAQLAFYDEDVQKYFELKRWACISDISSLHELAGKILRSISGDDYHQLTLDNIQSQIRHAVNGKRYLLVFDDIWDEDRKRWLELRRFLCGGKQGSKILVTSRSKIVAQNMGTVEPYELKGLPEDKSWDLFRSLAFSPGQEEGNPNLVSIGRDIVKKCANVPLAIKTISCLLYSMDTEIEWEAFKDKELATIEQNHENSILLTLKLSYDRLVPQLKQCFAYCSLFPKDDVLLKQDLIYLWMAQGFLGSSSGHQNLEDVGHKYFMQLTRRCFFQDIEFDEDGEIISCKMHDLVHDLAQLAAGGESLLVNGPTVQPISDNIWHVSFRSSLVESLSWLLAKKQMRSFLHLHYATSMLNLCELNLAELFSRLRCLRALDLGYSISSCVNLPDSLGELKHLRYLRLGEPVEHLPKCITRLQNLQTLDLQNCEGLRKLPRGFSKLINLRHLHFHFSTQFNDMPPGFGQLTFLRALDQFVVGKSNGLDALGTLNHLAGWLTIRFRRHCGNALSEATKGILKDKKLTYLTLDGYGDPTGYCKEEAEELALRCLQPPQTLKSLTIEKWKESRIPSWGMDEVPCLLPNLVEINIMDCRTCQHLPCLSRLPHLKSLRLEHLNAVEYIGMDGANNEASSVAAAEYFQSLNSLSLNCLPELKGWSRAEEEDTIIRPQRHPSQLPHPFFPCLSELMMNNCRKLKSMPLAPRLESLIAREIHEKLLKHLVCAEQESASELGSSTTSLPHTSFLSTLRSMEITSISELEYLSINLCSLESLVIEECEDLMKLNMRHPTSLRELDIRQCGKLRDISSAMHHLTVLEELTIWDCEELESLRGLGCLTGLQRLTLNGLSNLRALPDSIG